MTFASLILIPLIAGFSFSITWIGSKFRTEREVGYKLYFRSAFYGLFLLTCAFLIHLSCFWRSYNPIPWIDLAATTLVPELTQLHLMYIHVCIYTLILGLGLGHVLNYLFKITPLEKIIQLQSIKNNDFEILIHKAMYENEPVSISMSNGKVYVGYVISGNEPGMVRTNLRVLPYMSGFRSEEGRVTFTTSYTDIYESVEDIDAEKFEIVLPVNDIQSINIFDFQAYAKFQKNDANVGVLLLDEAWDHLDDALKSYTQTGPIGKFIYCDELYEDPDSSFIDLVFRYDDADKMDMQISIPKEYIKFIARAAEEDIWRQDIITSDGKQ